FSSRRRHTRFSRDWSSDVCSSDLVRLAWSYQDSPHIWGTLGCTDAATARACRRVLHGPPVPTRAWLLGSRELRSGTGIQDAVVRSEERRVGKEGRGRWWP